MLSGNHSTPATAEEKGKSVFWISRELRSALGAKIRARAIVEPLQCCPMGAPAAEMRELLGRRGFDVAGAMNDARGPVIEFVIAAELTEGDVGNHKKPLGAEHLISEATPIADLLCYRQKSEPSFSRKGGRPGRPASQLFPFRGNRLA